MSQHLPETDPQAQIPVMELDDIGRMAWNLFEQAVNELNRDGEPQDPFAGLLALTGAAMAYAECMGVPPEHAVAVIDSISGALGMKMTELHKKYHGVGALPGTDTVN